MKSLIALFLAAGPLLAQPPLSDLDGDGVPYAVERILALNPDHPDSDKDGTPDGEEVGFRVLVWRDAGAAWLIVMGRTPDRCWATIPDLPHFDLLPLLAPVTPIARAVAVPAELTRIFEHVAFGAASGPLRAAATLIDRPTGWATVERRSINAAVLPAEAGTIPGVAHAGPRFCQQVLEPMGGGPLGYQFCMVVDEGCKGGPPVCVLDCSIMIGRIVLLPTIE
jgi:hypothetical protein